MFFLHGSAHPESSATTGPISRRTPGRMADQSRPATSTFSPARPGPIGCPSATSASTISADQMHNACDTRPWCLRVAWRSPSTPRRPMFARDTGDFGTPPPDTNNPTTVPVRGAIAVRRPASLSSASVTSIASRCDSFGSDVAAAVMASRSTEAEPTAAAVACRSGCTASTSSDERSRRNHRHRTPSARKVPRRSSAV